MLSKKEHLYGVINLLMITRTGGDMNLVLAGVDLPGIAQSLLSIHRMEHGEPATAVVKTLISVRCQGVSTVPYLKAASLVCFGRRGRKKWE